MKQKLISMYNDNLCQTTDKSCIQNKCFKIFEHQKIFENYAIVRISFLKDKT